MSEKVTSDQKKEGASGKPVSWRAQAVQLAAIVAVVFVAKGALAEPFYVPSGSMEPTLLIGDALLASKFAYGYGAATSSCSAGRATARKPGSSAWWGCRATASSCGRASSSSMTMPPR